MRTGELYPISLKKGQVLRYSNNILAGKWQIKSNCPRGLDMSRAEQISVCTHITQVLCITQRALHFISFQMFCSAPVSLSTDVYFSHMYHSQLTPLSHSQRLRSSPGTVSKSLSSAQSPVRMWESPLCFTRGLRQHPCRRTRGAAQRGAGRESGPRGPPAPVLSVPASPGGRGCCAATGTSLTAEPGEQCLPPRNHFPCSQALVLVDFFGPAPAYRNIQSDPLKGQV